MTGPYTAAIPAGRLRPAGAQAQIVSDARLAGRAARHTQAAQQAVIAFFEKLRRAAAEADASSDGTAENASERSIPAESAAVEDAVEENTVAEADASSDGAAENAAERSIPAESAAAEDAAEENTAAEAGASSDGAAEDAAGESIAAEDAVTATDASENTSAEGAAAETNAAESSAAEADAAENSAAGNDAGESLVAAQSAEPALPAAAPAKGIARLWQAAAGTPGRARRLAALLAAALAVATGAYWFVTTTPGWHSSARSGQSYLIMPGTHKRARGVYAYEGVRYVFDGRGLLVRGWGECEGHTYYADDAGRLLTGIQSIDGTDYYLDPDTGEYFTGFYDTDAGRIAYSETGYPLRGVSVYQGVPYYFNADGIMQTGWTDSEDGLSRYYALEDGTLQSGWQDIGGVTYNFDPDTYAMHRSAALIDGKTYCFDVKTGALLKNAFAPYAYGTCYAGPDGVSLLGWQDIDGSKYYFDDRGYMVSGYQTLDGDLYFFDDTGKLLTGFQTIDDFLFYFGEDGVIVPASVDYEGVPHLFDATGRALDGWQILAETTYYYVMGVKQTGEKQIDDVWYNLGSDGILRQGWSGDSYYSSTGYALTGWQTIGRKLYYFDKNGIMARNTTIGQYRIDANGVATKRLAAGNTAASCYSYVRRNMRYTRIPSDTYSNMLNYAMTYHRGACYHYATYLNYVLNQAGISNSIIWGRNPQGGTHVWNQLSNGYILDACNGYFMITTSQMRAMGFSW